MDTAGEQVVRTELIRVQQDARQAIHRGVALIAVVPVMLVGAVMAALLIGGFAGFMAVLVAIAYMFVGSIAGVAWIIGGVADHRRAARELRGIDDLRKLPEARIVQR